MSRRLWTVLLALVALTPWPALAQQGIPAFTSAPAPAFSSRRPISVSVEPGDTDWHPAAWHDNRARILIGPGSAVGELDEGTYGVWVRVTTAEERPVIRSGTIKIT